MAKALPVPQAGKSRIFGASFAGALFAIASILLFLFDTPSLHPFLGAARLIVVVYGRCVS